MLSLSFILSSRYECFKYKNTVNYALLFLLITYSVVVSIVSNFFLYGIFTLSLAVFLTVEECCGGNTKSLSLPVKKDKLFFCWENYVAGQRNLKPFYLNHYIE